MTHHAVAVAPEPPKPTQTVMDHIRELQSRLFSVILTFIIVAALAYPFFDKITEILVAPLQGKQELIYLTPGGAFSFILKVCIYIGIIGSLPVIIYNLYRFVMPAVKHVRLKTVLKYTLSSFFLAICGIVFAYYVSLPASLYFLTSFNLHDIKAMLTIDSYFSFVMTYLLAGALLFQLPLVMLIIDSVSPLTPRKLMSYQRHMIVGSFVVAAIISPTPDALNQALLASPVVIMYQLGILMIWLKNRKKSRSVRRSRPINNAPSDAYAGEVDTTKEHSDYMERILNEDLPKQTTPSHPKPVIQTTSAPISKPAASQVRSMGEMVRHAPKPLHSSSNHTPTHKVGSSHQASTSIAPVVRQPDSLQGRHFSDISSSTQSRRLHSASHARPRPATLRPAKMPQRVMKRVQSPHAHVMGHSTVTTPFRVPPRRPMSGVDGMVTPRQVVSR